MLLKEMLKSEDICSREQCKNNFLITSSYTNSANYILESNSYIKPERNEEQIPTDNGNSFSTVKI